MDDNKTNRDENQPISGQINLSGEKSPPTTSPNKQEPQVIYETTPVEEVPPEVESPVPEEVVQADNTSSSNIPQYIVEDNRTKYLIIGGGVLFFILIFIIILRFLIGGKGSTRQVKLVYWGLWDDKEIVQPLIQKYQQANKNVTIEYVKMAAQDDYREKLIARSKNAQGPDIFRFHNTWLPELKELVTYIPPSIMSSSEFEKTFYPVHQQDLKLDKSENYYYGMPLYIDGLVLIYNDGWFKKSGITTIPTTWDDVISISGKLNPATDENGKLITGSIALGTANNVEHYSDILSLILLQNGASIKKLDSQEGATALEFYRLFTDGKNKLWDENMPNSVNAFAQEKVAMIIAPSWEIMTIANANPDIDLKVVPVPTVPGIKPISIANYWVEGVSKYSKEQLEAWKFLRFLVEKENLAMLYENQSKVRLFGAAYSRVDMASLLAQNKYLGAVIKQGNAFVSFPAVDRTYDKGLNDSVIQYFANAINSAAQGTAYTEAMKTAQQGVNQVLTQYGLGE